MAAPPKPAFGSATTRFGYQDRLAARRPSISASISSGYSPREDLDRRSESEGRAQTVSEFTQQSPSVRRSPSFTVNTDISPLNHSASAINVYSPPTPRSSLTASSTNPRAPSSPTTARLRSSSSTSPSTSTSATSFAPRTTPPKPPVRPVKSPTNSESTSSLPDSIRRSLVRFMASQPAETVRINVRRGSVESLNPANSGFPPQAASSFPPSSTHNPAVSPLLSPPSRKPPIPTAGRRPSVSQARDPVLPREVQVPYVARRSDDAHSQRHRDETSSQRGETSSRHHPKPVETDNHHSQTSHHSHKADELRRPRVEPPVEGDVSLRVMVEETPFLPTASRTEGDDTQERKQLAEPLAFGVKKGGTALLIVDPQIDLHEGGPLAVPGASVDSIRTAGMIEGHLNDIHQIVVTLDSHLKLHIASPFFWRNSSQQHPPPYTFISEADIQNNTWVPTRPELSQYVMSYVQALEANKRGALQIFPEHCLIGTTGHAVVKPVNEALQRWSGHNFDTVNYVHKGSCPMTEMYSCLRAEVEVESDPSTHLNRKLLLRLQQADRVLVCGQALSHCVQFTIRDLIAHWPRERIKDIWLIEDQCSSVSGFEAHGRRFIDEMRASGVVIVKTRDAFPLHV